MTLPKRDWMEMTWQEIAEAAAATARWIAVLPLAAVEQHGPHLPLGVDTFIAEAYLARVRNILPDELPVTFLPAQLSASPWSILPFPAPSHCRWRPRPPLDRARREPGAGGLAQTRSRHQPRRQCRSEGIGGTRFPPGSHAGRHRRLAPLRLPENTFSGEEKKHGIPAATTRPPSFPRPPGDRKQEKAHKTTTATERPRNQSRAHPPPASP